MTLKNMGKRNRTRGHAFERKTAQEWRDMGWHEACTTRYSSRKKDDQKIDIDNTEPFNLQCKATNKSVNYQKELAKMPKDTNHNLILSKITGKGEFVIMKKEDFYEMLQGMRREGVLKRNDQGYFPNQF